MSRAKRPGARRETAALSLAQVRSIVYDMGWEPEDAQTFWRYALRETRDPGCLDRERSAYFARLIAADDCDSQAQAGDQ